eukprot:15452818-Alexandrium_andersonii.AAC.1
MLVMLSMSVQSTCLPHHELQVITCPVSAIPRGFSSLAVWCVDSGAPTFGSEAAALALAAAGVP